MAEQEKGYQAWLVKRLAALGLEDEMFADYVNGIVKLEPSVSDDDEKREGLVEFLSEATSTPVDEAIDEMITKWNEVFAALQAEKQAQKEQALREKAEESARMLAAASQPAEVVQEDRLAGLSEEKRRQREILLRQYADESVSESDSEEGEGDEKEAKEGEEEKDKKALSEKKKKKLRKATNAQDLALAFENTNRSDVAEKRKAQMEQSRQESVAKKAQDKAALLADREKKAKEKEARQKKAQKGERRS